MSDTLTITLADMDPALAADLAGIAAERGHPISLSEAEHLRDLAEKRRRALDGDADPVDRTGLLPRSVAVGNIRIHSLSIAARIALRKLIAWAPELDQETYDILEAWVYAHAWDWAALAGLIDISAAGQIVETWAANLTCSPEQLADAIAAVNDAPMPAGTGAGTDTDAEPDPARILDSLLRRYGGRPQDLATLPVSTIAHIAHGASLNDAATEAAIATARGGLPPAENDAKANAVGRYTEEFHRLESIPPPPQKTEDPKKTEEAE